MDQAPERGQILALRLLLGNADDKHYVYIWAAGIYLNVRSVALSTPL